LAPQRRPVFDRRPTFAARLWRAAQLFCTAGYSSLDGGLEPAPALRVQYDWSYYYQPRPGILLEKSPPNVLRSRWLQLHFRPSQFVAIIRHPYAVCEGIRRRDGHTIEEAALHWVRANECLLEDVKHLQDCLCLRYEELCQQPEDHLEKLESFLSLDAPIDRKVLSTPRSIHNIDAIPQPICNLNERSLAQLSACDLACIDRIAGPLMQRLGYAPLRLSSAAGPTMRKSNQGAAQDKKRELEDSGSIQR
jgi:hypothetical protein